MVDRAALAACLLLAPMAVAAESMEEAVDAHRLAGRELLVAGDAVLGAGAIGKIVMTGGADEARMVVMQEARMVDR